MALTSPRFGFRAHGACSHVLGAIDDLKNSDLVDDLRRFERIAALLPRLKHPGWWPQTLIDEILESQDGECNYCSTKLREGSRFRQTNMHIDHMIPLSKGGSNSRWNLQALCADHNLRKGAMTDREFRRKHSDCCVTKPKEASWVDLVNGQLDGELDGPGGRELLRLLLIVAKRLLLLVVRYWRVFLILGALLLLVAVIPFLIWWVSRHRREWSERAHSAGRRARDTVVSRLRRVPTAPARAIRGVRTRAAQARDDIGRRMPGMDWHLEREARQPAVGNGASVPSLVWNRFGMARTQD